MIYLWRGFHSAPLLDLLKSAWKKSDLVILCPPPLHDFKFIRYLPADQIALLGDFSAQDRAAIGAQVNLKTHFDQKPLIGVFTSGTTSGVPKLVLYSKENIENALSGILTFFESEKITDIFCYPQPFHTFGLTLGYLQSILYSRKLWIPEGKYSRKAHELRASIPSETLLTLGAPAHFYDLIEWCEQNQKKLNPSYSCIVGGAKVEVDLWKKLQTNLHIQNPSIGYGSTEACPGITHHPPGLMPLEAGEIGFPIPGVKIEIREQEGIEFTGKNVCLAMIDALGIHFPKRILLRDEIRRREKDGMLIYVARNEFILNRGGTKYPLEVLEAQLDAVLKVKVYCAPTPDARLGEDLRIKIFMPQPISEVELQQLKAKAQQALLLAYGHHFDLALFEQTQGIPKNQSGKVDRASLFR